LDNTEQSISDTRAITICDEVFSMPGDWITRYLSPQLRHDLHHLQVKMQVLLKGLPQGGVEEVIKKNKEEGDGISEEALRKGLELLEQKLVEAEEVILQQDKVGLLCTPL